MKLKFYEKPVFINYILFIVNLSLFISKLIFSSITNSLALQADAFDNLTDIIMVIAALMGIIYSKKKPNEKFPYGYYKIENIVALIISIFIFFTAYNIIFQSITEILAFYTGNVAKEMVISPFIFIFLVISLLISFILAIYLNRMGKRTKSPIIISEAKEKFLDIFISLSVVISFIGALFKIFFLDSIIGLIIALFIIKGGYDIFISSTKTLLDAVVDFEERTELHYLIGTYAKIKRIENLEIRSFGRYIFVEVIVTLNKDIPLSQIETMKKVISSEIKEKFPQIFKIIVITQTEEKEIIKVAAPLSNNEGLSSKLFVHYGESPFFALLYFKDGNLLEYDIIPNKFLQKEKRKGILISDWLSSERIDKIYLKKELKIGPRLIFEKSLIVVEITNFEKLNEIIEKEKRLSSY
jgi:cation diffusion facilitator family transporter